MAAGLRMDGLLCEIERLPPLRGADPDAFYAALVDLLGHHGLPSVGACWHLTDPVTGLVTWTGTVGELPGDFLSALHNEFAEDDVAKYADIATRRICVAGLVSETGGRPQRSARYRQQFAPDGFGDELRLAFVDRFGRWGSMGLFGEAPYRDVDVAAVGGLVPLVARRLRESIAMAAVQAQDAAPGVLLLDADDRVRTRDSRSLELLDGCAATGSLPGAIHIICARARAAGAPAHGRMLTRDTRWIEIDANPLADEDGTVAIVLRPAPAHSMIDVRLRAAGLTDRERQIALALLRGDDTATISATLHLSPWTVQDHLKAIFDKTGVRSRRTLVARWALHAAVSERRPALVTDTQPDGRRR